MEPGTTVKKEVDPNSLPPPSTNPPIETTPVGKVTNPIVPNFLPELKPAPSNGVNNGAGIPTPETVKPTPSLAPTPAPTPIGVAPAPATNTLSKLLTTPGAPTVIRPSPRPSPRPQTRPATTYLTNIAARNPVDYNLYRTTTAGFPNYSNGTLTSLPAGYTTNYPGIQPQLGGSNTVQTTLPPQLRPATGRPIMGRAETPIYSVAPNTQPISYRPSPRPQYNQGVGGMAQARPRGGAARPGYVSSPAISMANSPAATPVRASAPSEKMFPLLFSQLTTTNQILLGECLTKLKNKLLPYDEFFRRTQEIFGSKHTAFIQAIGFDNFQPVNPPPPTTSMAPVVTSSPAPPPVATSTSKPPSFPPPTSLPSQSQATSSPSLRAPLWNPTTSQVKSTGSVSHPSPTYGQARPPASPQVTPRPPPTPINPPASPSVRPPPNESRTSNGEDNRVVDFDNLTDVMGSAGVDLREESENIMRGVHGTGLRGNAVPEVSGLGVPDSYAPPSFVTSPALSMILSRIIKSYQLTEMSPEVMEYLSLAVEERLRSLIDQMVHTSRHRALAQQTYPAPPTNDLGKPIYKIIVHHDPRKQLQALERVDKDRIRKYYLRLEEGSQIDEDGEPRSKKIKNRRDAASPLTATASARNMSEESRKANANQTTHMFTGGLRKSWMLAASTTPRISSPLASTPPTTSRDTKDTKRAGDREDSTLISVKRHAPAVSSSLASNPDSGSRSHSPAPTTSTDPKPDSSRPSPTTSTLPRTKPPPPSSPSLTTKLTTPTTTSHHRFGKPKSSTTRSLSLQDALFVLEGDTTGRPHSPRAQLIMRTYATLR